MHLTIVRPSLARMAAGCAYYGHTANGTVVRWNGSTLRNFNGFSSSSTSGNPNQASPEVVVMTDDDIPPYPTTSRSFVPRYNGPPLDAMTDEQRKMRDTIIESRPRTGISGPFGPWLAKPEIGWPSQELGRACRYGTSLSMRESELVILLTGARHRSHAEFDIHQGEALRAGLTIEIISAIPRDDDFSLEKVQRDVIPLLSAEKDFSERDVAIVKFAAELLETCTVSDETYAATKAALGGEDSVLVEITSIVGYYTYCAYTLNVFKIPTGSPK